MDHPDFSDTKPQQALNYLWSTLQAAGAASTDTEKAYITVREALNDRYLRPDVARMLMEGVMALRDWHSFFLIRRGYKVHQRADPACVIHRPPRPGSRLDRVSRGLACPRCVGRAVKGKW